MSFIDKIQFWKKDDDLDSLPPSDFDDPFAQKSSDPMSQQPDPFAQQGTDPLAQNSYDPTRDPMPTNTPTVQNPFEQPDQLSQQGSLSQQFARPEQPKVDSFGRKLARDYVQQQSNPPQAEQKSKPDDTMEIVNLKLDAIKSELDAMGTRIKKIESIVEKKGLY